MSIKSCCNFKQFLFVLLNTTAKFANFYLFLEKSGKTILQFDLKKNFVKHIENLPQHLSEKFIGNN